MLAYPFTIVILGQLSVVEISLQLSEHISGLY